MIENMGPFLFINDMLGHNQFHCGRKRTGLLGIYNSRLVSEMLRSFHSNFTSVSLTNSCLYLNAMLLSNKLLDLIRL